MFIRQEQPLLLNGWKGIMAYAWIPAFDSLLLKKIGPILLKKNKQIKTKGISACQVREMAQHRWPLFFSLKRLLLAPRPQLGSLDHRLKLCIIIALALHQYLVLVSNMFDS